MTILVIVVAVAISALNGNLPSEPTRTEAAQLLTDTVMPIQSSDTPSPTHTTIPTSTDLPTPTNTSVPTSTHTTAPTSTDLPTPTNTTAPTSTDLPTSTNTIPPTLTSTDMLPTPTLPSVVIEFQLLSYDQECDTLMLNFYTENSERIIDFQIMLIAKTPNTLVRTYTPPLEQIDLGIPLELNRSLQPGREYILRVVAVMDAGERLIQEVEFPYCIFETSIPTYTPSHTATRTLISPTLTLTATVLPTEVGFNDASLLSYARDGGIRLMAPEVLYRFDQPGAPLTSYVLPFMTELRILQSDNCDSMPDIPESFKVQLLDPVMVLGTALPDDAILCLDSSALERAEPIPPYIISRGSGLYVGSSVSEYIVSIPRGMRAAIIDHRVIDDKTWYRVEFTLGDFHYIGWTPRNNSLSDYNINLLDS